MTGKILAVDFDNTLVDYRDLFAQAAKELGLASYPDKTSLRDQLRQQFGGEHIWQKLQAEVYGHRICAARAYPGARESLETLSKAGWAIHIVSHKTNYAAADPGGVNLREAALEWLQTNDFVPQLISAEQVHFADDRRGKCQILETLQANFMVDDLAEFLSDPAFPLQVKPIHFVPDEAPHLEGITALRHWAELANLLG